MLGTCSARTSTSVPMYRGFEKQTYGVENGCSKLVQSGLEGCQEIDGPLYQPTNFYSAVSAAFLLSWSQKGSEIMLLRHTHLSYIAPQAMMRLQARERFRGLCMWNALLSIEVSARSVVQILMHALFTHSMPPCGGQTGPVFCSTDGVVSIQQPLYDH